MPNSYFVRFGYLGTLLFGLLVGLAGCSSDSFDSSPKGADVGQGGSMARFAIMGNTLYTVDDQSLRVFDLSSPTNAAAVRVTNLGVGIETIFPKEPYLFIGTQQGMFIFDASNPQNPRQLSYFQHVVSCDPVVVQGRYAYLTLRQGRTCGGGVNQLQVVDLQNLQQPRLAQVYPMAKPYGLGADSTQLYVCDDGLKVFDIRRSPTLTQREHHRIEAFDVIPNQDLLLVIGADGLYQYRRGSNTLTQLSMLPIARP
ncbi:LVIVD repeat-containing protein [Solirubrum puertoriconensis]|uniref:LVIVD repeat-containing protein n=1 Tax=Solirubrum puertoriconensis TaxID=1751427 RepID=A0A9X0HNK1_SOLP1|nr:hypothetical protein [Solirubrum puertoriconensis]KUG09357.1 hypothetical protein ASU33_16625 [Solirubrum puertoriconensis]